jgi:hypothetical protein
MEKKRRKKSDASELSITATFDDICRLQEGLVRSGCEDDVIRLLRSHEQLQKELNRSLQEVQELKSTNHRLTTENTRLNKLLKLTRSSLASEARKVNESERELKKLKQKLALVDGVVKEGDHRKIEEIVRETMSRISYLDISDESLSDIEFDTSEDDLIDKHSPLRRSSSGFGSSSLKQSPTSPGSSGKENDDGINGSKVLRSSASPKSSQNHVVNDESFGDNIYRTSVAPLFSSKVSGVMRTPLSVVPEEDEVEHSIRSLSRKTPNAKRIKSTSRESLPSGYSSTSSIEHPECIVSGVNDYDRLFPRSVSDVALKPDQAIKKSSKQQNHFLERMRQKVQKIF